MMTLVDINICQIITICNNNLISDSTMLSSCEKAAPFQLTGVLLLGVFSIWLQQLELVAVGFSFTFHLFLLHQNKNGQD